MKIPISERHEMSMKQEEYKRALLNHRSTIAIPKKKNPRREKFPLLFKTETTSLG